ncbi:SDR family oxidoreductase [Mycobacterium spongiae]|uniref:NAD-dependent epimerase/dehydratase family protein n=1 Tax=Mycobacterium spongiae TaxID=886343 RepID=A0A975PW31_9MYCO|nr:SDR family oxidoreductase [Mycobacterium spongiae]QUR66253.1 NAD-dependent epimerase/dehydratase family protein [Mycobacterium spongiae]
MDTSNGRGGTGGVGGDNSDNVHLPKVVLVTGACRFLGGYLTARLAQNPLVNRVIAVDAIAPSKDMLRRMGRAEFVRADIRNPFIGKVIRNGEVDTVVHAAAASYAPRSGGGAALKELNVMGAMQLFAACHKAPSVRRVVLKSTSEVYGSSPHDPVVFTEDSTSRRPFRDGFAKDSLDIEGYVRGLGRRRPDIAVSILRLANLIGPAMDTTLSRYLAGPLVPTMFGRDARLQLLHEQDALGALERAAMAGRAGTFNIGADGIIMLSQAIRRAGRIPVPVPVFGVFALDSLRRANRYTDIGRDQFAYLSYGRVMDTTRMRSELDYQPKWSTAQAFDDYLRGRGLTPIIDPHQVRSWEARAVALAQRWGSRNPIPWGGVR